MRKKTLIITILMFILILVLAGCGGKTTADKDGEMLQYSIEDIYKDSLSGFYVKNTNGTFTPVMSAASGYESSSGFTSSMGGTSTEESASRFLWWNNNNINLSKLIPKVTKDTPLVGIFPSSDDIPTAYTLERYNFKGYTIGVKCEIAEDKSSFAIKAGEVCSGSHIETALDDAGLKDDYSVYKFNKSKATPVSNVNPNTGVLLGLEKNGVYELGIFDGTDYKTVLTYADTLYYEAGENILLQNPITKTEYRYFIVNIPANLDSGCYYICDDGLFQYEK